MLTKNTRSSYSFMVRAKEVSDNEKQLVHGAKLFADSVNRAKYPAFVIFPQCPESDFWAKN